MKLSKKTKTRLILVLVAASIILTIYDWSHIQNLHGRLQDIVWVGTSLLISEIAFIAGALLMAVSAGESLPSFRRIRHWPGHFALLRRDARSFAEHLLTNRLFAVGFWLNFVGAVGTSLILVVAIIKVAPYTGAGLLAIIVIDLLVTFGWRVPLEIARRRARKHGVH